MHNGFPRSGARVRAPGDFTLYRAVPAPPAAVANEGPLSYVFGTEKITSTIDLEILNIEEPKVNPDKAGKPGKSGKKKDQ